MPRSRPLSPGDVTLLPDNTPEKPVRPGSASAKSTREREKKLKDDWGVTNRSEAESNRAAKQHIHTLLLGEVTSLRRLSLPTSAPSSFEADSHAISSIQRGRPRANTYHPSNDMEEELVYIMQGEIEEEKRLQGHLEINRSRVATHVTANHRERLLSDNGGISETAQRVLDKIKHRQKDLEMSFDNLRLLPARRGENDEKKTDRPRKLKPLATSNLITADERGKHRVIADFGLLKGGDLNRTYQVNSPVVQHPSPQQQLIHIGQM